MTHHGEQLMTVCLQNILAKRFSTITNLPQVTKRLYSNFYNHNRIRPVESCPDRSTEAVKEVKRLDTAEKHYLDTIKTSKRLGALNVHKDNSETVAQWKSLDLALVECIEENDHKLNSLNGNKAVIVNNNHCGNNKNRHVCHNATSAGNSSEIQINHNLNKLKKVTKLKKLNLDTHLENDKGSHTPTSQNLDSLSLKNHADISQQVSNRILLKNIPRYVFKKEKKNVKYVHMICGDSDTCQLDEKENDSVNINKMRNSAASKKQITDISQFNEVNIEMLPLSLGEQIFGTKFNHEGPTPEQIESSILELQKHNLLRSGADTEHMPSVIKNDSVSEQSVVHSVTARETFLSSAVINDVQQGLQNEKDTSSKTVQSGIECLKLPPLLGQDIEEHFWVLGEQQASPYRSLLLKLVDAAKQLPQKPEPTKWELRAGWTRYDANGNVTPVDCPPEDALVFDVEVCCQEGVLPTLAVAAAPESKSWYGWVSQSLAECSHSFKGASMRVSADGMIPLEPKSCKSRVFSRKQQHPRVIVAHHAAFDRSRVREQYSFHDSGTRFVDTLSLHVCVSSVTDEQRMQLRSGSAEHEAWSQVGSLNALQDLARLYCSDMPPPDKSLRDVFVKGSIEEVRKQFPQLMDYCASDVFITLKILQQLLPLFLERFPHPVTLAGMLELGTAFLPVDDTWNRYLMEADATFEELNSEVQFLLAKCANTACQLLHNEAYLGDTWMWDQDWSVQQLKLKQLHKKVSKPVTNKVTEKMDTDTNQPGVYHEGHQETAEGQSEGEEEANSSDIRFEKLARETAAQLPARLPHLPGYPAWYRKLCSRDIDSEDWCPEPHLLTTAMQVTPKLLRLSWEGFPLHYLRGYGWGFLLPQDYHGPKSENTQLSEGTRIRESKASDMINETEGLKSGPPEWYCGTGIWTGIEVEGHWFLKLPHKDGASARVGNPLSREFLGKFAEQVLAGDCQGAQRVLEVGRMLSYWRNNRDRVHGQVVVWHSPDRGVLLPQVIVSGTLTRRAVESTWMTASNARSDRVGSELRAMVRAPPGFCIVGADVDSQELWIAGLLGDAAQTRIHGGTPLGWMTLAGKKKDGTDMHSVTARAAGISRDQAKVLNYARIYGAGQAFAERVLQQFNPGITQNEARTSARRMFSLTKGRRVFRPLESLMEIIGDKPVTKTEALRCARQMGKPVSELFHPPQWEGGTESAMFNRLEEIACSTEPQTPFLGGHLTRALENSDDRTLPTRVNWVVQSGAVDFLHLLLVSLRWLLPQTARFCLSFHDEVRYIVPERDRYRAATAMHVSNLMARAFCSSRVGLYNLPLSVAFFSSVEVDKVLRKEATDDCVTPSNPHGLNRGYGIPPGESLDITTALKLCNYKPWAGLPCASKPIRNVKEKKISWTKNK